MKKIYSAALLVVIVFSVLTGCSGNGEIKALSREALDYLASEDEEGFRELYHPKHKDFDYDVYKKNLPIPISDLAEEIEEMQTVFFNYKTEKEGDRTIRYTNAEYKVITKSDKTYYLVVKFMSDDEGEGFKQFSVTLLGSDSK